MATPRVTAPTAHRFTRAEYHRMGEAGLFRDERVELLDGEVVTMSPKLTPHAFAVHRLTYALVTAIGSAAIVRFQDPIVLDDWSEPEPDVAVCAPAADAYLRAHPQAGDVRLVIEVAQSSLAYDRSRKARAYATARIPEYWIVNLVDGVVEVHGAPDGATGTYRHCTLAHRSDTLTLPGGATVAVADFVPAGDPAA